MSEMTARLEKCFAAVFPGLDAAAIAAASQDNVSAWDSVAAVTLLTVIEEEFGVTLDFEEMEKLTSFQAVAAMLAARTRG